MKTKIGILLFILVFGIQSLLLPNAGMTWDEPSSFFFGRANLKFWLTRDRSYLTDLKNPEKFRGDPFEYIYGEDLYPPFSFIVSSAFSYILSEKFNLISTYDAHHMGQVLIGALGIVAIYGIGLSLGFSVIASLCVAAITATYPTIIGHMRNDAKDAPLMAMICISVFFFLRFFLAIIKNNNKQQALFGFLTAISYGLTVGTKVSGAIMIPILFSWVVVSWLLFPVFRKKFRPLLLRLIQAIFFSFIALLIFIFIWPWLWDSPIEKLNSVWNFFKVVGYNMPTLYFGTLYNAGVNLPKEFPFSILAIQTPPLVLLLFAFGIISSIFRLIKKRDPFVLFPLIWFIAGMGRYLLPNIIIYAKIRHFIDVMPAFFLIMGMFLDDLSKVKVKVVKPKINLGLTIGLVAFISQVIISIKFYPYEPSYFNFLAKGSREVADKRLFDIEYWASGVKEAMDYIAKYENGNEATVYACTMGHLARFYEKDKIKVVGVPGLGKYTLLPNSASWFGMPYWFLSARHGVFYTVRRDGADLFYVIKHKSDQIWFCGYETDMVYKL